MDKKLNSGDHVLVIWQNMEAQEKVSEQISNIKSQIGENGSLQMENSQRLKMGELFK